MTQGLNTLWAGLVVAAVAGAVLVVTLIELNRGLPVGTVPEDTAVFSPMSATTATSTPAGSTTPAGAAY
ncbi:MAG: hypothetical protein KGI70_02765 [Patescibacteria group bacterium]|nr:hypothetical protein [Patescibacteria group bacterium]